MGWLQPLLMLKWRVANLRPGVCMWPSKPLPLAPETLPRAHLLFNHTLLVLLLSAPFRFPCHVEPSHGLAKVSGLLVMSCSQVFFLRGERLTTSPRFRRHVKPNLGLTQQSATIKRYRAKWLKTAFWKPSYLCISLSQEGWKSSLIKINKTINTRRKSTPPLN